MSRYDYESGLKGEGLGILRPFFPEDEKDWKAGNRDRLANQDLADRINKNNRTSSCEDYSSPGEELSKPTLKIITVFFGIGIIFFWDVVLSLVLTLFGVPSNIVGIFFLIFFVFFLVLSIYEIVFSDSN